MYCRQKIRMKTRNIIGIFGGNMKKYLILFMIAAMMILVSCHKAEPDDTVRIWMYEYSYFYGDTHLKQLIESEIKNYAKDNNIKVEFNKYSEEELKAEDYILKRNIAVVDGNADIVIGDIYSNMIQISKYAGDYTKLNNYKNIFENYKGKYCIPIGSYMNTIILDKQVIKSYGIECDKYITMEQYYEIKQTMKENGAQIRYDRIEDMQLFNYYINKNNLAMIKNDDKYDIDRDLAMKTIKEISKDLQEHYIADMDFEKREEQIYSTGDYNQIIFDEASGCPLAQRGEFYPLKFMSFTGKYELPFEDYSIVLRNEIEEEGMDRVPCVFINKNTKKDNSYKIADFLISDKFQTKIYKNTLVYSTIIDTPEIKEQIGYDKDWNYKFDFKEAKKFDQELDEINVNNMIKAVQKSYEIFKNTDTNKLFNVPREYNNAVREFLVREVYKIIDNPSYDEAEFNKNADEFLTNFNVQYN